MSEQFDLVFEIPSKTFIVGEYLAINGTASMIAATEPAPQVWVYLAISSGPVMSFVLFENS